MLCLLLSFSSGVKGETISQKEASAVASKFFSTVNPNSMAKPTLIYNGRGLTTNRLFNPFYVYNNSEGGFVIVSAENKAFPVLAYSLSDKFNPDEIDDSLRALLKNYAADIERIRYVSNIPYMAIEAWQDLDNYIKDILNSPYDATDPDLSVKEALETLESIESNDSSDDLFSFIYSPEQWTDMINDELNDRNDLSLGLISGTELVPFVIHGRKGDFYRLRWNDKYNDWLMRLSSTEIFNDNELADLRRIEPKEENEADEIPFMFLDEILSYRSSILENTQKMLEDKINPKEPIIKSMGGGKYEIKLPEKAILAQVYNLSGSMVNRYEYKNSDLIHVSLEGQPYGFYFIRIVTEDGNSYGAKILR